MKCSAFIIASAIFFSGAANAESLKAAASPTTTTDSPRILVYEIKEQSTTGRRSHRSSRRHHRAQPQSSRKSSTTSPSEATAPPTIQAARAPGAMLFAERWPTHKDVSEMVRTPYDPSLLSYEMAMSPMDTNPRAAKLVRVIRIRPSDSSRETPQRSSMTDSPISLRTAPPMIPAQASVGFPIGDLSMFLLGACMVLGGLVTSRSKWRP